MAHLGNKHPARDASSQQDRTFLVQAHQGKKKPEYEPSGGEIKDVLSDFSCDCKPGEQLHLTQVCGLPVGGSLTWGSVILLPKPVLSPEQKEKPSY